MTEILPFPGGAFLDVAPPEARDRCAAALVAAMARHPVASDVLMILADAAEEAERQAPNGPEWMGLGRLLRTAASAFANVPLPAAGQVALPAETLLAAARALRATGLAEMQAAAARLQDLASAQATSPSTGCRSASHAAR